MDSITSAVSTLKEAFKLQDFSTGLLLQSLSALPYYAESSALISHYPYR